MLDANRRPLRLTLAAGATALLTSAVAFAATHQAGSRRTLAIPPPSSFTATIDNVWFPLKPGSRYTYVGVKDGLPSRDIVTVSRQVRMISGVPCAVVTTASIYAGGYASARPTGTAKTPAETCGTSARTRPSSTRAERSRVPRAPGRGDRRRRTGDLHARPSPIGESSRQEFYKGHAEDHFKVIGLFSTVAGTPGKNALLTEEWTPLEPGTLDHKLYVRGIGTVLEHTEHGGSEHAELVAITR